MMLLVEENHFINVISVSMCFDLSA